MKYIIAIDPGRSGGFAFWNSPVSTVLLPMPDTEGDIVDLLRTRSSNSVCYLEKVGGFVRTEGGQPGSAMFKFGFNFGFLQGVLMALQIPIILVTPQKWQASLGIGKKGNRSTREWKNALKAEAQRRYPALKITLKTCDALLLLDYAVKREIK